MCRTALRIFYDVNLQEFPLKRLPGEPQVRFASLPLSMSWWHLQLFSRKLSRQDTVRLDRWPASNCWKREEHYLVALAIYYQVLVQAAPKVYEEGPGLESLRTIVQTFAEKYNSDFQANKVSSTGPTRGKRNERNMISCGTRPAEFLRRLLIFMKTE